MEVIFNPWQPVILPAVKRWIGRDKVPDQIMRHKGVGDEMFKSRI